jgi:hypothetical protein
MSTQAQETAPRGSALAIIWPGRVGSIVADE